MKKRSRSRWCLLYTVGNIFLSLYPGAASERGRLLQATPSPDLPLDVGSVRSYAGGDMVGDTLNVTSSLSVYVNEQPYLVGGVLTLFEAQTAPVRGLGAEEALRVSRTHSTDALTQSEH
jgi:hypothetical protein